MSARAWFAAGAMAHAILISMTPQAAGQQKGYTIIAGDGGSQGTPPPMATRSSILDLRDTSRPVGDEGTAEQILEDTPARPMGEAERRVRVVGPKFFPDPEEAIDLRAPARNPVR